jgi:hypothetical protein
MRFTPILQAALLAGLLGGCFMSRDTVNEPLLRDRIDALVLGQSTAQDVAAALGAPNDVVQLGHRSAWRYDFTTSKTAGFTLIVISFVNTDLRSDRCWLFFDKDDVLQQVGSTYDAGDAEYSMPWEQGKPGS